MGKVKFSDIFSGDFLGYVSHYRKRIQEIINNHEVVIFMARKAVCFYKAMELNGELTIPSSCTILSSRVAEYNTMEEYKGKTIAVIDDVVVKGESLKRVVAKLDEYTISADILVVAWNERNIHIKQELEKSCTHAISDGYIVLEQKDVFSFAGMITKYIEASMCPFNIDQPIYEINIENSELYQLLYHNHAIDITSGIQQHYEITNHVFYLKSDHDIPNDSPLSLLNKGILKIRILSNGIRTIAVPFVLFPGIKKEQLEIIFSLAKTDNVMELIKVDNECLLYANKLKIINYFFSEMLINSYFKDKRIKFEKQKDNDMFLFSRSTCILFEERLQNTIQSHIEILNKLTPTYVDYNKFDFPNILASCYQAISEINPEKQDFINFEGKPVEEPILTHDMFCQAIIPNNFNTQYLASCVIDIFIDCGTIVPSIVYTKSGNIIRAYKLGEYSKLTKSQIESFAAMLYEYQDMIDSGLGLTEFEKLCVLFFKMLIEKRIFQEQESYEDGCYSICYSLYGPRVSTSAVSYKVGSYSALITKFCSSKENERIVNIYNGKYVINTVSCDPKLKKIASAFAFQYSEIWRVFQNEKGMRTPWVRSYTEYLTLRAIGNNRKNQYLSLCAELRQVTLLLEEYFNLELSADNEKKLRLILSGIDSGLWKYWCYSNNALDKTTEEIVRQDKRAGSMLLLDPEPAYDENKIWQDIIRKAGEFLYEIAFFINEILKVIHKTKCISKSNVIIDGKEERYFHTKNGIFVFKDVNFNERFPNAGIFKFRSYNNPDKNIKMIRESVETIVTKHSKTSDFVNWYKIELKKQKKEAKLQLDLCDIILANYSPSVTSYKKYLIVYSKNGLFPKYFSTTNVLAKQELRLYGLSEKNNVKIFGLTQEQRAKHFLTELFTNPEQKLLCYYFALDLDNLEDITYMQLNGNNGRNSILVSKINEIITKLKQEEPQSNLFMVSPKEISPVIQFNSSSIATMQQGISSVVSKLAECFPESSTGTPMITIQFNIAESGGTINGININFESNNLKEELEQFIVEAEGENKKALEEALLAIDQKNESKLKLALKKAASFVSGVASKLAASVVVEYMKQKGLFTF